MERLNQGIDPAADISRFSAAMVEQSRPDDVGYHFETGTACGNARVSERSS